MALVDPRNATRFFLVKIFGEFAAQFRVIGAVGVKRAEDCSPVAGRGVEDPRPPLNLVAAEFAGLGGGQEIGI